MSGMMMREMMNVASDAGREILWRRVCTRGERGSGSGELLDMDREWVDYAVVLAVLVGKGLEEGIGGGHLAKWIRSPVDRL